MALLGRNEFTHWGLNKIDIISKGIFQKDDFYILIHITLKFVPGDPMDNKLTLVEVMAWW